MSVVLDPNAAVNDLADRFWDGVLERDPLWATVLGDERFNDRWPDLGPQGRAADEAAYRSVLAEAREIPADGLDPEQVITRDLLTLVAENQLEALAQKQYQLAVDHMSGPQIWPAQVAQYQPADTPERVELVLARYAAYPAMIEQYVGTLAEGVADGRTAAAVPVHRAIEQIDRLLALPAGEAPATTMVQVGDDDRARVAAAVEEHIYAGLRRLRDFLAAEYEPHARQQPGISATPGGDAAYRLAIRMQTTLDATAEEVHAFGLADLEAIEAEKDEIARRLGHADRFALREALAQRSRESHGRPRGPGAAGTGADRSRLRPRAAVLRPAALRELHRQGRRGLPRGRVAAGLLHAALGRRLAAGPVLHQHLRADGAAAPQDRGDHLPRGHARPPLPDRDRDGAGRPPRLPHARRPDGRRRLRRGMGPLLRAPRR